MSDTPNDTFPDGFGGDAAREPHATGPVRPSSDRVWSALVEDLPPNQRAWLAGSRPVTLHESTAIIAVADDFTRNQIEGRLRTRLEDALGAAFDRQVRIAVTVDPELGGLDRTDRPATGATAAGVPRHRGVRRRHRRTRRPVPTARTTPTRTTATPIAVI